MRKLNKRNKKKKLGLERVCDYEIRFKKFQPKNTFTNS